MQSTDKELAETIHAKLGELNTALAKAVEAGLEVQIDTLFVQELGGRTTPRVSAEAQRIQRFAERIPDQTEGNYPFNIVGANARPTSA
jgi:hypothetical protein